MEITALLFLSSGLFLGWSLGANDAANVFGTAVGSRMVKFATAAAICSIFVILGAVVSGAGAAHTLGKLGAINALGGSFMAAFAAALTVMWMTKLGLPVSTSQAVVGAIIGWNLFSQNLTDMAALWKIVGTWIACPILGCIIAATLHPITRKILDKAKLHLLRQDSYTRWALILAGAFGSYSLGANNIANVMGVFVRSSPFTDFEVGHAFTFSSVQQLFLVGGVAIAVGVYTYSKRVMMTVGSGILPLTPVGAWVVVISHSIVLFLFASTDLEHFLASHGLPTIPLVPVSSSQAVVGAVIGIGLTRGRHNIKWSVLARISSGWISTPIISAVLCFVFLFFLQNVFNQSVYQPADYVLGPAVVERVKKEGFNTKLIDKLVGKKFNSAVKLRSALRAHVELAGDEERALIELCRTSPATVDAQRLDAIRESGQLSEGQLQALMHLRGREFQYPWMVSDALSSSSPEWRFKERNKLHKRHNRKIQEKLDFVFKSLASQPSLP